MQRSASITFERKKRREWVASLKVGDKVTRMLAGVIPMELTIGKIEGGIIYCQVPNTNGQSDGDWWKFDQMGCEIDEYIDRLTGGGMVVSFLKQSEEDGK